MVTCSLLLNIRPTCVAIGSSSPSPPTSSPPSPLTRSTSSTSKVGSKSDKSVDKRLCSHWKMRCSRQRRRLPSSTQTFNTHVAGRGGESTDIRYIMRILYIYMCIYIHLHKHTFHTHVASEGRGSYFNPECTFERLCVREYMCKYTHTHTYTHTCSTHVAGW